MMEAKNRHMALALCTGCGIGQCIDADKLAASAAEFFPKINYISHTSLCSETGLAELKELIREKEVQSLAVAACSPRAKSAEFDLEETLVERINLREQVAWVMEAGSEDTQMCAEDQTRMALARSEFGATAAGDGASTMDLSAP